MDYEDLGRRLFLFGFEGLLSESRLRCHEGYCICNGGSLHRHEGGGYWEMFTLYGKKGVYPNGSILHKVVMCHLQLIILMQCACSPKSSVLLLAPLDPNLTKTRKNKSRIQFSRL